MTALPPAPAPAPAPPRPLTRGQRMLAPALTIGGLTLATLALHVRDPHDQGSWGVCPSYALFGVACPGCGGLRAVNDLTNFGILDAASSNLLFFAFVPVIVWVLARWAIARWRGQDYLPKYLATERFPVVLIVVMIAFTVLRNLPGLDWLKP